MRPEAAVVLLFLLSGSGCLFDDHPHPPANLGKMGKLWGSAENLDVVQSPDRVEAFRLRPAQEQGVPYNRWPTSAGPVRVAPAVAQRLSTGLTRPSTYGTWDAPKACEPRPGLLLRFHQAGRSVDVAFCFECDILFTYRADESIWYANFDEHHDDILKVFIEVFPKDASLPALLKKRDNP
ncbi:MAG TPA: hypothetical protein VE981_24720 [Planctomycetota bacterium]|nr:hypothetical protein [Planctomycetota bacterium]